MPEKPGGHYVRTKQEGGTWAWTWVGSHAEEIAHWYSVGREHGRRDAEKEAAKRAAGSG